MERVASGAPVLMLTHRAILLRSLIADRCLVAGYWLLMDRWLATHSVHRRRGEAIEVHTWTRTECFCCLSEPVAVGLGRLDCLSCLGAVSSLYEPEVIESDKHWSVRLPPYRARHPSANVNAAK